MNEEVGEIEFKKEFEDSNRVGIRVNGNWYNKFGSLPDYAEKGVVVRVKGEYNQQYDNYDLKSIDPYDEEERNKGQNSGDAINRQSAVKSACTLFKGEGSTTSQEEIEEVIQRFHRFIEKGEFE